MTAKEICGAKTLKGQGPPCKKSPMKGANRCRVHGGGSPQARRKAKERIAEAAARKALDKVGEFTPVDNPLTELASVTGRARGLMEILEHQVAGLAEVSQQSASGEQVRAVFAAYERAIDRTGRLVEAMARLGIDERLAAVSEAQADRVIAAIEALLDHLGVRDPLERMEAKAVAGRHLTAV